MNEVTKKKFYEVINPLDVVLQTIGDYPYTTIFKLRHGQEVGRVVGSYPKGKIYPVIQTYYLKGKEHA